MGSRINEQRIQSEWQPERMQYAVDQLQKLGIEIIEQDHMSLKFMHKGSVVIFYPYTGWHTGKTITDGRGIKKLLNQLKK